MKKLLAVAAALLLSACASTAPTPSTPTAASHGGTLVWLGQSAFKITTPGGKVIVTDPWLRTDPRTPAEYKKLESFGHIDVLLVSHGHFDHIADAPALASMYHVPLRAPGDLNYTLMALGVLPAELLPRMNKGGTITPASGIRVTAVHAEHSSNYVWKNPATQKEETHEGGEPVGWIIELENGYRIYFAGDTDVFGDMKLIGERYKPDLALVPIGGNFTMDPAGAAYAVKELLKPKAVIPMHYGTNPLAKGTAREFIDAMGTSAIRIIVPEPGQVVGF
jgi:L-ascorbate metabolism protein UlaG (beta-lactamase superfamily)